MDLSAIKPDTQKVQIRHPGSGAVTGLVFEVASAESDAVKRAQRKSLDRILRNRNKTPTADEVEKQSIDRLTAAIVGWEWQGDACWTGGKKLEFTKENVATVFEAVWVRKQVQEVIDDEAGFFAS